MGELLDCMDVDELLDWMAYERLEPFEPQRGDARAAQLMSLLVNLQLPRGKPRAKAKDFMPRFDERYRAKADGAESAKALQDRFIQAFGGTVNGR